MKSFFYSFLIVLIGFVSALGSALNFKTSDVPKDVGDYANNSYEKVEILEDVPNNYTFEIENKKPINDNNLSSYVRVTDIEGNDIPLSIKNKGDRYSIAPKSFYENGKSYRIELNNCFKIDDEKVGSN